MIFLVSGKLSLINLLRVKQTVYSFFDLHVRFLHVFKPFFINLKQKNWFIIKIY